MIIIDGLANTDIPLTVQQLEEVLSQVEDKGRAVVVNDETCNDIEITAIDFSETIIKLYINGKVVSA